MRFCAARRSLAQATTGVAHTMMHAFVMPKLGWTMEKGKVIKWMKREGDAVTKGEEILELETDKVTLKVEAPETGLLARILVQEGASAPVNNVIAVITSSDAAPGDIDAFVAEALAKQDSAASTGGATPGTVPAGAPATGSSLHGGGAGPATGKILASPRARALASERGVDLRRVRGTGPDGAITAADVEAAVASQGHSMAIERVPPDSRLTVVKEEPVEGIRKVIATRMHGSLQAAAQLTITTEVVMDQAATFRDALNKDRAAAGEPGVSFTDLLVLAVSDVLGRFPKFNASFDGTTMRWFKEINIGVATATDRGLMVPVVWGASAMSLGEISAKIKALAKGARANAIGLDELSGGTFTITNLGMFGIDAFTPITNPPEIAILGVGRIVTRPVYKDGGVKPAQLMVLSLTFDHQVIDGHEGALFLQAIRDLLESPGALASLHDRRDAAALVTRVARRAASGDGSTRVVIIGAGPAGNDAALLLASYGFAVTIVESTHLGGTCLNEGCVPVKHLHDIASILRKVHARLESSSGITGTPLVASITGALARTGFVTGSMRDGMARIYADAGIELLRGTATFTGPTELRVQLEDGTSTTRAFGKAIVATGAASFPVAPAIPTAALLARDALPGSIAFAGPTKLTLELASIYAGLGAGEVHAIWEGGVDMPFLDPEVKDALVETMELQDIDVHEPARIAAIEGGTGGVTVTLERPEGKVETVTVEVLVDTAPRVPRTGGLGLDRAGIEVTPAGAIKVDGAFTTTNPDVHAIGDVVNSSSPYTYLAAAQGRAVAGIILGQKPAPPPTMPVGLFTLPPVASVGMTERDCAAAKVSFEKLYVPHSRLVGSHLVHEISGMTKVLFDPAGKHVLGVQVLGELAHEVISTAALAVRTGATIDDLVDTLHLHPTMAEMFKEPGFQRSLKRGG